MPEQEEDSWLEDDYLAGAKMTLNVTAQKLGQPGSGVTRPVDPSGVMITLAMAQALAMVAIADELRAIREIMEDTSSIQTKGRR